MRGAQGSLMTNPSRIRRAFLVFHFTLGLALLGSSVHTVLHLGRSDLHALVIGSIEAVGAAAFLVPRTLRPGAALLLLPLGAAALIHAGRGEWRPDLLVYAAGVLLVAVHGPAHDLSPPKGASIQV
jgi:uncharacterized membrane protein YphA (DoxX/SURF4 family)